MKKIVVRIVLSLFILSPSVVWGMDPSIRAGHIMRNIERQRKDLEVVQGDLAQLREEQRKAEEALDPRFVLLEEEKAKVETLEGIQSALGAEEDAEITRQISDFETRVSELTDQLRSIGAFEQRQQLDALQKSIAQAQEDVAGVRVTIADLDRDLAAIPEEHRLRAQYDVDIRAGTIERSVTFEGWKEEQAPPAATDVTDISVDVPASTTPPVTSVTPPKKRFTIGKKTTGAIVTAIALAIATYIGRRIYQKKKERLIRKYKLAPLTSLQNSIWRAAALASIRMPWYLQYLIKNNTGTIADFVGSDSRAIAELYYGRKPTAQEVNSFITYFFRK